MIVHHQSDDGMVMYHRWSLHDNNYKYGGGFSKHSFVNTLLSILIWCDWVDISLSVVCCLLACWFLVACILPSTPTCPLVESITRHMFPLFLREGFTEKSRKKSGVLPNLPRKNPTFPQKRLFDSSKLLVQPSTHTHLNASLISIFVTIHDLWMWAFFYQMSFSGLARNYCSSLRHFPMQARPTTILSLALQYL